MRWSISRTAPKSEAPTQFFCAMPPQPAPARLFVRVWLMALSRQRSAAPRQTSVISIGAESCSASKKQIPFGNDKKRAECKQKDWRRKKQRLGRGREYIPPIAMKLRSGGAPAIQDLFYFLPQLIFSIRRHGIGRFYPRGVDCVAQFDGCGGKLADDKRLACGCSRFAERALLVQPIGLFDQRV